MMQLLSSVESGRVPDNEELMGHKYMKEVEHIKVNTRLITIGSESNNSSY